MAWSTVPLETVRTGTALTDRPAWLKACADVAYGTPLILCRDEGFLPLCLARRQGLTVAQGFGQAYRSVAGPILEGGAAMPALEPGDLPAEVDLVDLRRFPRAFVEAVLPSSPARLARPDILHFDRALEGSGEAFLASLSKGTQKDLRYVLRRVEKTFGKEGISRRTVRLDEENGAAAWAEAEAFARNSWQGQTGVSVLANPEKRTFFSRLQRNGMAVKLHFYALGAEVAAVAVTMEDHGHILIYAHEYHAGYAKYQPGHILNYHIMADAIDDGITTLDFGVGETPHKYAWQCRSHPLWRVMVPLTWKGWLALGYQKTRWQVAALRKGRATA
jgi:CelD/BcsL family acetyltransferase involved in cellulose biosynthesis